MKPNSRLTVAIWTIATLSLAALDVWLWLWTPGPGSQKSPWAIPIITTVTLLLGWVTLTDMMRSRMVALMRERGPSRAADAGSVAPIHGEPRRPPPPLAMRTLTTSNDPVRLSFLTALLADGGISAVLLDMHTSAVEGSIGAIPRRLAVLPEDEARARRVLADAG